MKNNSILVASLIFLLINMSILIYLIELKTNTFADNHMYTKAICDENNYCEDYKIACINKKIVEITPTGSAVQYLETWKDPRTEKVIKTICG